MTDAEPVATTPGAMAARPFPPLPDARQSLGLAKLDDLFPTGEAFGRSLRTFTVLLALSAFIASFGLYQDSVASIIGAMVVAPLGGAIMAFAGALVTARLRWQLITVAEVVLGATGVVVIAWLVSAVLPEILELTPSLQARTSPGLLDLGVALAAGAAGAYVAVRRTGTDALPGVAIAVSLVPPLATIGICLELERPDEAAGAAPLFMTNFAAITVAACVVFALAGAAPSRQLVGEHRRVRIAVAFAFAALVLISIPLTVQGIETAREWLRATTGAPIVRDWIGDRDLSVRDWSVEADTVTLLLAGPDAPDDATALATALAAAYEQPVELIVEYSPTTREHANARP